MPLSDVEIAKLDRLKEDLIGSADFDFVKNTTENIDLSGISLEDLKALTDSRYTVGLDFTSIDRSNLDTNTMNQLAPGSINVKELLYKLSNVSLTKGKIVDLVDTQSGVMANTSQVRANVDIEDIVESKANSQGTNMQMINRASSINKEKVKDKSVKSVFLE